MFIYTEIKHTVFKLFLKNIISTLIKCFFFLLIDYNNNKRKIKSWGF